MVIKSTWVGEKEWNWELKRSEEKYRTEPHLIFSREAVFAFLDSVTPIVQSLWLELNNEADRVEKPMNYLEMQIRMKGKHLEEVIE